MKMQGKCRGPKYLAIVLGTWRKQHLGGHDMARRMDRQGGVLIWCRKSSGHARQRMGQKLLKCCRPEQVGTTEYGKMFKRTQVFEDGRESKELEDRKTKEENDKKGIQKILE